MKIDRFIKENELVKKEMMGFQSFDSEFDAILAQADNSISGYEQSLKLILSVLDIQNGVLRIQQQNASRPFTEFIEASTEKWESGYKEKSSEIWAQTLDRKDEKHFLTDIGSVFTLKINGQLQGYLLVDVGVGELEKLDHIVSAVSKLERFHAGTDDVQEDYLRKFERIGETFSKLKSNYSLEQIQLELVNGIREILGCEAASIGLVDQNDPELVVLKTLRDDADWLYQIGIRKGDGVLGKCFDSDTSYVINKIEDYIDFKTDFDASPDLDVRSLLCVPLRERNALQGILVVYNKVEGGFTEGDKALINTIAATVLKPMLFLKTIQQLQVINAHLEASRWELIRSRNTLRSLIDNLPDSLYIIDRMYRIVAINHARASRANLEPRYLVGKICFEHLYNRSEPCKNCHVPETFFKKKITNRVEREWQDTGEAMEWDVNTYPIYDESGAVIQVILVEKDVTEKNRMEALIAQSEKMAAVGQLAAGIAHEINNPLTVIMANAQILKRELPDTEDWKELADLMQRAGERAMQSVKNLLNFARKEQLDFTATNVNETIDQALEMLRHEIMQRSVTLSFEPDDSIPEITASPSNLQSIWLNLIINAMDSFEGAPGKIKIKTQFTDKEIKVMITDNGSGISENKISRIFEPFFTSKERGHGTGLGLSIVHRIIKQHGGAINVNSVMGEGTTFTINFPTY